MVYLTMTPAIVSALETINRLELKLDKEIVDSDYSLADPAVGNPIGHFQVIAIAKLLEVENCILLKEPHFGHLDHLLRGSKVYTSPPKPKKEPTSSYNALMARLRREEEDRAYERMINPPIVAETFAQRLPTSQTAKLFPTRTQPGTDENDDEITYSDINRQMALIINMLVSIVACSVAIWMASSNWSTPKRLGLSMGGSALIGIGEVVVYAGYLRRVKEAREKGKKHVETKEIIKTWVIGGEGPVDPKEISDANTQKAFENENLRKRRVNQGKE